MGTPYHQEKIGEQRSDVSRVFFNGLGGRLAGKDPDLHVETTVVLQSTWFLSRAPQWRLFDVYRYL